MKHIHIYAICCLIFATVFQSAATNLTFPDGFQIGAASASYQIEGAWNVSGKGESVWDRFTHEHPDFIADGSNGDVACDSYHKYMEDVKLIADLGFDFYRFSISWTRIYPSGFPNKVSTEGIQYYRNLIKALRANNIEPVVTLYHWDHPAILEEIGGWYNKLMVQWMADYARVIFEELGPLVKYFVTINEPTTFCLKGHNSTGFGSHAPAKSFGNMGHYLCVHNVLKAHATIYHMYDTEFRPTQQGQIGILASCAGWVEGKNITQESIDRYFQFRCGWIMHPIFIGDYPEIMKTRIAEISKREGLPFSRLPTFTVEWIQYINGTADFFGLNHYTSNVPVLDDEAGDSGVIGVTDPNWKTAASAWLHVLPAGFGNLLRLIKNQYGNPPVYIFESGYSDTGELEDNDRIGYYYGYLLELLEAIKRDGCNVLKYTLWSLLDNFEWDRGYSEHFGIVHVDFNSTNRTREKKLSAAWWQEVLQTRTLQPIPKQ